MQDRQEKGVYVRNIQEFIPVAYETPREWLEGKRKYVQAVRRLSSGRLDARMQRLSVTDREVLEAALNWHEEMHEMRVVATRAAGIKLPMDGFAAEFELDDVEREIVELLLVEETDMTDDDGGGLTFSEAAMLLARGKEEAAQKLLPYFLPGSRLRNTVTSRESFGGRRLGLNGDTVRRLLGLARENPEVTARSMAAEESWRGDISEFLSEHGVVLGAEALESIRALWGLVRREDVISDTWGFGTLEQVGSGVCILFHGPSGTGKTMTAKALCKALGRKPLVVSYPDLVSKWVGETQKNTKSAFTSAARDGSVLIFDEADAVFARRTDVRHSTDRYANSEVNTLLVELERFPGVVMLTTNNADVLDPALERRIRYKVYFGTPDAAARAGIWRAHIPHEAPLATDVDLDRLARNFELTGGQIANAALTAASLAASRLGADSSSGQITMADFEAGARREAAGYGEASKCAKLGF